MGIDAEITGLLNAARSGDAAAQDAAYALVYDELKRCARRQGGLAPPGSTLSPTALVNELYLKLRSGEVDTVQNRGHFFALAARAMRQITVDHARRRHRAKRGGGAEHVEIDTRDLGAESADAALELDAALDDLARRDPDLARIVEWHFFAGLTFQEIADEIGRHERTVRHDWELARAVLRRAMGAEPRDGG
ncbi:RNA polymerase sigma factor (TIGR02999 family) [Dokdonella fugitiva]|uniref:RNA polymerase sigma factor (TIGR02999 family) n=1 Tax=Dokdonella fugitiva TaxID=328517 RepID=A0A839F9I1_9GAMM|nr:ECF-type sigma factor [Dokdonella fugitiva]MBA8889720.1 RNA polymerase sigma factor (TIGR02999 family) [Dokdonella fugitiva]